MPHTRELQRMRERERVPFVTDSAETKRQKEKSERKREEREKERKTERETERKETGRRERARVPFATDSAETRNKTKTVNSFCDESREPPHHPKLLYSLETKARRGDGEYVYPKN